MNPQYGQQANPLGGIMNMLPLLMILPMVTGAFGGSTKAKPLTHSPGRDAAKYALAAVGIAGGLACGVVGPILLATLTPPKITNPADVTTPAQVGDYLNLARRANFAAGLTISIGGGVGGIADGIATMLAKA